MKNKFLLIAALIMLFAACERLEDDRQYNHTKGGDGLVGLLGIKVVALPADSMYLTCDFANHHFEPVNAIQAPYYFKIPGGYFLGYDNPEVVILGSVDPTAPKDTLLNSKVTGIDVLKVLEYPTEMSVVGNNGLIAKYIFWYE